MAAIPLSALPLADVPPVPVAVANCNLPTRQVFRIPPLPDLSSPFPLVLVNYMTEISEEKKHDKFRLKNYCSEEPAD